GIVLVPDGRTPVRRTVAEDQRGLAGKHAKLAVDRPGGAVVGARVEDGVGVARRLAVGCVDAQRHLADLALNLPVDRPALGRVFDDVAGHRTAVVLLGVAGEILDTESRIPVADAW